MPRVFGAYGNHLFTEYCSNPLQQCFCVFETCTTRWRKMACFFFSHMRDPLKVWHDAGSLICVPCCSPQLDWQIPSPRPGSVLNTIHCGAGLPLLSEPGCGPELSVATLCLFSSPPTLPWAAAGVSDCTRKRLLVPSRLIYGQYLLSS